MNYLNDIEPSIDFLKSFSFNEDYQKNLSKLIDYLTFLENKLLPWQIEKILKEIN